MNIRTIKYNKDIAIVIINDPKTYNSLSSKNLNDLIITFKKLDKDKKVKVIIRSLRFLLDNELYVFGSLITTLAIYLLCLIVLIFI